MKELSRFQKYQNKFKPDVPKDASPRTHLGSTLVMELGDTVAKRLREILPLFIPSTKPGDIEINCSNSSYWDAADKYLVMNIFIRFDKDVVWKEDAPATGEEI